MRECSTWEQKVPCVVSFGMTLYRQFSKVYLQGKRPDMTGNVDLDVNQLKQTNKQSDMLIIQISVSVFFQILFYKI